MNNTSQNQNMSSTAWFMPFNIEPPNTSAGALHMEASETGVDGCSGLDEMMDLREWAPFSPGLGTNQDGS